MEIRGHSADELYNELWWKFPKVAVEEQSRNGPVLTVPRPVMLELAFPERRVLFNEARDCNPFFHIAEVVWMFAGSKDVRFVEQFNKRYREYADPGTDWVWGAYGHRWINHYNVGDQIEHVIEKLANDRTTRQAVISMWNTDYDLCGEHNDRPCNTHIYFRVVEGQLDMTVCNRSNDAIWGALGANVVHFTYLQEVIAHSAGLELGYYRVVTNNLHMYPGMPRYTEIQKGGRTNPMQDQYPSTFPVLQGSETWKDLQLDCVDYIEGRYPYAPRGEDWRTQWMEWVAYPMMEAYLDKPIRRDFVYQVRADDWHLAAKWWMERRG